MAKRQKKRGLKPLLILLYLKDKAETRQNKRQKQTQKGLCQPDKAAWKPQETSWDYERVDGTKDSYVPSSKKTRISLIFLFGMSIIFRISSFEFI